MTFARMSIPFPLAGALLGADSINGAPISDDASLTYLNTTYFSNKKLFSLHICKSYVMLCSMKKARNNFKAAANNYLSFLADSLGFPIQCQISEAAFETGWMTGGRCQAGVDLIQSHVEHRMLGGLQ